MFSEELNGKFLLRSIYNCTGTKIIIICLIIFAFITRIPKLDYIVCFRAFRWTPPKYGHLPLVLNKDGTKLSKRQGDISIAHYRNQSYYALALANFVTKSGGGFSNHNVDKLCSLEELAEDVRLTFLCLIYFVFDGFKEV